MILCFVLSVFANIDVISKYNHDNPIIVENIRLGDVGSLTFFVKEFSYDAEAKLYLREVQDNYDNMCELIFNTDSSDGGDTVSTIDICIYNSGQDEQCRVSIENKIIMQA